MQHKAQTRFCLCEDIVLCLNRNTEEQDKCFVSLVCRERLNDNDVVGLEEVQRGQNGLNGVKC